MPTREIFLHLATWMQVVFYVAGGLASLVCVYGFWRRVKKYRRGRREKRFDGLVRRALRAARAILSGSTVRRGEPLGGAAHALILWGFLVLFAGTVLVAVDHDFLRFVGWKLLEGDFYLGFSLVLDVFGVLFILGLVLMILRRAVVRPAALDYTRADGHAGDCDRSGYVTDDLVFLWSLLAIAVSGFAVEGLRIAQGMPDFERWSPVGWGLALALDGVGTDTLFDLHVWFWWAHGIAVLLFVAYVPFSKAMHILTDAANLVFTDEMAGKRLPAAPAGRQGYARIGDFTWKELLDLDACTKCGRCHVACPARASGTTLSPRDLILDLRSHANAAFATPELLGQRFGRASRWPFEPGANAALDVDVARDLLRPETLWSCTTCLACIDACPVGVEHLTSIVQLRRHLVDVGAIDDNLQTALMGLGDYGNSFGESPKRRARWTKGLSFKVKDARKEQVDWLWFVGDYASYDPRVQELTRAFADVLHGARVDFGLLYDAERNAGNDARRVGEEGLFEMLTEENLSAFGEARFSRVVTTDPHSFNTLRNEYPDLGFASEVVHSTGLIATLLSDGKLAFPRQLDDVVTYHDPCYLARYNGEIDAPRRVLRALGVELREMPRNRASTLCCGAGGGRIWMDTSNEKKRTSEQRVEEALALGGVRYFVTACPKDYVMYSDAVKSLGAEDEIQVRDLIDLCRESLTAS